MGWQDIAALALVALAAGYLARLSIRAASTRKAGGGCGSACGGCAGGLEAEDRGEPLVTIGPPRGSSTSTNGRATTGRPPHAGGGPG